MSGEWQVVTLPEWEGCRGIVAGGVVTNVSSWGVQIDVDAIY